MASMFLFGNFEKRIVIVSKLLALFVFVVSCNTKKETILAKVYDEHLYLSDAAGIFQKGMTPQDSISLLNLFVENWVRDKLFENEAKRRISDKDRIEKQVKEYRSSLTNYAYENLIIKEQLDSSIEEDEIRAFYDDNKSGFKLEYPLIKCLFVKIPKAKVDKTIFQDLWNSSNEDSRTRLKETCAQHATLYMLEDTLWNNANEIIQQFPKAEISHIGLSTKKDFKAEDENNLYFLKVLKHLPAGEITPYSHARKRIIDVFLIQRKKEAIEKSKDQIFEKESRRHNFFIYTNRVKVKSENK